MVARYFCTIQAQAGSVAGIEDPPRDVASGLALLLANPRPLKPGTAKREESHHAEGHGHGLPIE